MATLGADILASIWGIATGGSTGCSGAEVAELEVGGGFEGGDFTMYFVPFPLTAISAKFSF